MLMMEACQARIEVRFSRVAEVWPHELVDWVHGRHLAHQCYDVGLLARMPNEVVLRVQERSLISVNQRLTITQCTNQSVI